jgi:hypothetical protein
VVPARVRIRPTTAGVGGGFYMTSHLVPDFAPENDLALFQFTTHAAADVNLALAAATAAGQMGATLTLPRITITSDAYAEDVVVRVPLPAFVSVASISASQGVCSGSTTVECFLGFVASGSSVTIDVFVNASAVGSASTDVRVTAANGVNSLNDTRALSIATTAAAVAPPVDPPANPPGGGKKGGGSFEWFSIAWLAVMVWRRGASRRDALRAAA